MKLIQTKDYLLLTDKEAEIKEGDIAIYDFGMGYNLEIPCDKDNLKSNTRELVVAYYPLTKEAQELVLPLLPNPFLDGEVDFDYDKLGELKIQEALIAFENRHGYALQTLEERDKKFKETGIGGDYLVYSYYDIYNDELILYYTEVTPHDCPYYVNLTLPLYDNSYPIIPKVTQSKQFSLDDIQKAFEAGVKWHVNPNISELDAYTNLVKSLSDQQLPKEFIPSKQYTIEGYRFNCLLNSEGKEELIGTYR